MLLARDLTVRYGSAVAVEGISFSIEEGEVVTLIGPNGAGKTSTLLALMGLVDAGGEVRYRGDPLNGLEAEARVARGLVLVHERRHLFGEMSVEDNLLLGAFSRYQRGERDLGKDLEHVYALFPRLAERRRQLAATMSGGEQQMLAIGRALMARPKLLMLDEPSLGLAPLIVKEIFRTLAQLKEEGTTLLLVEQNARAALALADRAYVLEAGRIVLAGEARVLQKDRRVVEHYLGVH
jgi:ABC-type branched-chain amino acid transport systems, ATPase component